MKIIFLDIDGVLNHMQMFKHKETDMIQTEEGMLSKNSISLLNRLTNDTRAKIVISSTWRKLPTKEQLIKVLKKAGITGDIIDTTPVLNFTGSLRGNEILQWIKTNSDIVGCSYHLYKDYVILDDDSDMLYWQRNNFLQVDPECGISESIIYKASNILGRTEDLEIK